LDFRRYGEVMLNRTARISFAMLVLAAVTVAVHATEADQPPAPKDSKSADSKSADSKSAAQAAPGQEAENKAPQATPAPGANAAGAMVFIDPVTGKMVQPTEAQIDRLARSPQAVPKSKAPAVTIQGPGGAVGIVLTPESFNYSIATRTADGKIALDCVTGGQAADRIAAGSPDVKAAPKAKGPLDENPFDENPPDEKK
jgi:hypothetical protein